MRVKLLEVRRARNWSQQQLSFKSGISRNYISEIENGRYDPTTKTICKLCKALNCSPNDLIDCGGDEDEKQH